MKDIELGKGKRAELIESMQSEPMVEITDKMRSEECEADVQSVITNYSDEYRLLKVIPSFIKWPIWKAKPRRFPNCEPMNFKQLEDDSFLKEEEKLITKLEFAFKQPDYPRYHISLWLHHGELGTFDRRVYCGLQNISDQLSDASDNKFHTTYEALAEHLNIDPKDRYLRDYVSKSLWRLHGTAIRLEKGDPLYKRWTSEFFSLIPSIDINRLSKKIHITYKLPDDAVLFIKENKLTTVDMHRLSSMDNPGAESLYCLLYDVAQAKNKDGTYKFDRISYQISGLASRLGFKKRHHSGRSKAYPNWWVMIKQVEDVCKHVSKYAGILRDYSFEGEGENTYVTFWLSHQRLHLPN